MTVTVTDPDFSFPELDWKSLRYKRYRVRWSLASIVAYGPRHGLEGLAPALVSRGSRSLVGVRLPCGLQFWLA